MLSLVNFNLSRDASGIETRTQYVFGLRIALIIIGSDGDQEMRFHGRNQQMRTVLIGGIQTTTME